MSAEESWKEGRVHVKDGDLELEAYTFDGICFPPFPSLQSSGGFPKRIRDIINMDTRPDDILLAAFPRSGSNWTSEIINMLLNQKAEYQKTMKFATMLEAVPDLKMTAAVPSPRLLNLHLPYRCFPKKHIQSNGKIIHVTRNPKDAHVSLYHRCKGTLILGKHSKDMTWNQYFDHCVLGKVWVYGTWFAHENEMAAAKKTNKNIYTLRYEDLKADPVHEITKLAKFLGVKVNEDLVQNINEKCSFQNLKNANEKIKEIPRDMEEFQKKRSKDVPNFKQSIYRKGEVGDWKNYFTVAQCETFDDIYAREMKGINVD